MPTLSVVRYDIKKILKIGGIIIAIIIALFVLFKMLMFVKNIIFPPPPPTATALFNKLTPQAFPDGINREFKYEVDTISGEFPEFPNIVGVYKLEQRGPDILAVEEASKKAEFLGYNRQPEQISDFVYQWKAPEIPNEILTQDIRLDKFTITSNYKAQEEALNNNKYKSKEEAIEAAKAFLQGNGMLPEDIDDEKTKVDFFILENETINPSTRIVTANLATVYFFQKAIEEIPFVYPQGPNSSMRFLVGAIRGGKHKPLDADFTYQKVLAEESSTYPIKTAELAFEDLKAGKGTVVSYNGNETDIKIKNIYLAYYFPGELQDYLMPVIVFEGKDEFIAYVPAITDEWIDK